MMFGIDIADGEKIMGQWVEEVIKRGVVTTVPTPTATSATVEEVIKRGVVTTGQPDQYLKIGVEEVIKRGVVTK